MSSLAGLKSWSRRANNDTEKNRAFLSIKNEVKILKWDYKKEAVKSKLKG